MREALQVMACVFIVPFGFFAWRGIEAAGSEHGGLGVFAVFGLAFDAAIVIAVCLAGLYVGRQLQR